MGVGSGDVGDDTNDELGDASGIKVLTVQEGLQSG